MSALILFAALWLGFELSRGAWRVLKRRRRIERRSRNGLEVDRALAYRPRSTRGGRAP